VWGKLAERENERKNRGFEEKKQGGKPLAGTRKAWFVPKRGKILFSGTGEGGFVPE